MIEGYIYILTNAYVPGLVKIGYTERDPETRASELSATTGVPGKWTVIQFWYVLDAPYWEQAIFSKLTQYRETGEFFKLTPDVAIQYVYRTLNLGGAVDESGISPTERERESRREKARLTREEQLARELRRQQRTDAMWDAGWATHIKPWCDHNHYCQKVLATYKPPNLLSRLWSGEQDVLTEMRKWAGYKTLKDALPLSLTLSRNARRFRCQVGRSNATARFGQPISASPTDWDDYHPCRPKGQKGPFAWLFFLDDPDGKSYTSETLMLECRLVVQEVFGLDGDTATRFLSIEADSRRTLLQIANSEPPPEFSVPFS